MENWEINWKDYYKILQLHPAAEQEVVKGAYEKLAKKYHPDVNKTPAADRRMKEINEAFEILGNLKKRRVYHTVWLQLSSIKDASPPPSTSPPPSSEPTERYVNVPYFGFLTAKEIVWFVVQISIITLVGIYLSTK